MAKGLHASGGVAKKEGPGIVLPYYRPCQTRSRSLVNRSSTDTWTH